MTIEKHTKAPWVIAEIEDCIYLQNADKNTGIGKVYAADNARRIVACVNACAHVSTEFLENTPDLATAFMSAENARLIQVNAELLESLRDIKSRFESCIGGGNGELPSDKCALGRAAEAIAKAEAI